MELKKIEKAIDITASKEHVWRVLTEDQFTRQWYSEFSPGSYAETDWKEGSKVIFADESKSGMIATVVTNKPLQQLSVEMNGELVNGKEEYETESAQAIKGNLETYTLSDNHGLTHLAIETAMVTEYYDTMVSAWDRALEKVRMLSEMQEVQ